MAEWCRARVAATQARLAALDGPAVLVSHWPLIPAPVAALRHPAYAPWCGTTLTADWHTRYPVVAAVYGHLHIPRTTYHDGVRFEEVSVGYPREWRRRGAAPPLPRVILGDKRADPRHPSDGRHGVPFEQLLLGWARAAVPRWSGLDPARPA